jgi:nitroreductase
MPLSESGKHKGVSMSQPASDVWSVMSTARTIRRFTDKPVDDSVLARCLQAATWAPSGANAQRWRFIVLRSSESRAAVATAAAKALEVIEPVYGMTRPEAENGSRKTRNDRATYEIHDRAGEFTSVLFTQKRFPTASELLLGGFDFSGNAELPVGCSSAGPRGLSHELGLVWG